MAKLEGLGVRGGTSWYFSLWVNGERKTGGSYLYKAINLGVPTGDYELTGASRMVAFRPLIKWSED